MLKEKLDKQQTVAGPATKPAGLVGPISAISPVGPVGLVNPVNPVVKYVGFVGPVGPVGLVGPVGPVNLAGFVNPVNPVVKFVSFVGPVKPVVKSVESPFFGLVESNTQLPVVDKMDWFKLAEDEDSDDNAWIP